MIAMEQIQYIGIDDLDAKERAILDKLSAEYYDTIQRSLKNEVSITIHVKKHKQEEDNPEKQHRFEITIKVAAPTAIFEEKHAEDWDFARTLHKAFKNIERQIQHRLHTDDQHNKG